MWDERRNGPLRLVIRDVLLICFAVFLFIVATSTGY